jgi:hypothetical protein
MLRKSMASMQNGEERKSMTGRQNVENSMANRRNVEEEYG